MSPENQFKIEFPAPPSGGWLQIQLTIGPFVLDDYASWVLNDPLHDFAELGVRLRENSYLSSRLLIFLEPEQYIITFDSEVDNDQVAVSALLKGRSEKLVPEPMHFARKVLARKILSAIRRVQPLADPPTWNSSWRGYPSDLVRTS